LGRVSNLPTVWSNCLAAWLLGGDGSWDRFAILCMAATLLYTGGMFLNDAFDADFDRQYRRERPIPSGRISQRSVCWFGITLLAAGLLAIAPLGLKPSAFAAALVACIVIYDAVHKRLTMSPLLMSACRFLLYLVAASAAHYSTGGTVVWRALALAIYVSGLSFLARGESTGDVVARWPILLLFAPIALALIVSAKDGAMMWMVAAVLAGWILWCVRGSLAQANRNLRSGVAGLLAGIVVVDWLAVANSGLIVSLVFVALFLVALVLQRLAPAT
jgi:UbiA prenyltransferase family